MASVVPALVLIGDRFASTPDWVRPTAILTLGAGAGLAAWRWLTPGLHPKLLHRGFIGLLLTMTLTCAVLAGNNPESATGDKKNATQSLTGAPHHGIRVTHIGGVTPGENITEVPHCLTVSGSGRVPEGYGLWVANNSDKDGKPEVLSHNSMQRVTQPEGQTSWTTDRTFGVGEGGEKGQYVWLHVFLLPHSTDKVLKRVHGGAWGIQEPYPDTVPIDYFKVRQDGVGDC
ncbi:hypothetical protein [Streptomyces europaeiscabiei]|uniref:hypothetical protein n=1 Tax=Streptomyces europaeiscabiei TaxID=146819 RepID=UPI002E0D4488|nr:hypothetical protein OHB30_28665 [Streptomyces europaeiscabiei]